MRPAPLRKLRPQPKHSTHEQHRFPHLHRTQPYFPFPTPSPSPSISSYLWEAHGLSISTHHIPSVLNLWADRLSGPKASTHRVLNRTFTGLLLKRFRAQQLGGEGLPDRAARIWLPYPLVIPQLALLPIWHCHLSSLSREFLVSRLYPAQAWFQQAAVAAEMAPLSGPSARPSWPSVLIHYRGPPSTTLAPPQSSPMPTDTARGTGVRTAPRLIGSRLASSIWTGYERL